MTTSCGSIICVKASRTSFGTASIKVAEQLLTDDEKGVLVNVGVPLRLQSCTVILEMNTLTANCQRNEMLLFRHLPPQGLHGGVRAVGVLRCSLEHYCRSHPKSVIGIAVLAHQCHEHNQRASMGGVRQGTAR